MLHNERADGLFSDHDFCDLLTPHLLPHAPSAWHEHVPFAHWLIKTVRPAVFVELGSHAGVSFSAFCRAMQRFDTPGKAYAVDTWQGDEQAGVYDEEIYVQLSEFVKNNFREFAQLVRNTFDDAVDYFSNKSIDLLHIDGLHTYEAVKHDFETWLPKMSDCGVILFHDVNCRNEGFGVWRLWEEVSKRYPFFEFYHGSGLGVLVVGSAAPDRILRLTSLSEHDDMAFARNLFAAAGRYHGAAYDVWVAHAEQMRMLKADRDAIDADRQEMDFRLREVTAQLDAFANEARRLQSANDSINLALQESEGERGGLFEQLTTTRVTLSEINLALQESEDERGGLSEQLTTTRATLSELQRNLGRSILFRIDARIRRLLGRPAVLPKHLEGPRRPTIRLRLRAAWRHPFNSNKRKRYRLQSLTCLEPWAIPLVQDTVIGALLSHFNESDRAAIVALDAQNVLPTISAVVFVNWSSFGRIETIIRSLREQEPAVFQVFVHCADDVPIKQSWLRLFEQRLAGFKWIPARLRPMRGLAISSALEAIANDDNVHILRHGEEVQDEALPADGVLVIAGSVNLRAGAAAILGLELLQGSGLVYSDEVFVSAGGQRTPFFKPAYSPRLAESSNYMGSCGLVAVRRRETPAEINRILRAVENDGTVARFLTRRAKTVASGSVVHTPFGLFEETDVARRQLPKPASVLPEKPSVGVSILIPTRDRLELLEPCVQSVIARTAYPRDLYEIIIIDNGSVERPTLDYLRRGTEAGDFSVIRDDGDFNYARLNNNGVKASYGEVLLFLNNDTLITQPDWLHRLASRAMEDGVGLVGAKLLYEDGTVQHGGVVLGIQGVAAHVDVNNGPTDAGYHGLSFHDREVSAVTGACMATRRVHFDAAGGFDENLAVAFNDTLLCVNMLKLGLVNVQQNSVVVTHLESKSRGYDDTPARKAIFESECRYAREQGQNYFLNDVYYNPNLSLHATYQPAEISRRRKPWRAPRLRDKPSILLLSSTHQRGHGVPVVIEQQAKFLCDEGWDVHVGGPATDSDFAYEGCTRTILADAAEALCYAKDGDIDIVMPHTPPFFSVSRETGPYPIVAAYDHGEPPPELFADETERRSILKEKAFSLVLSHRLYCNSESVKEESGFESMIVASLANSHLKHWTDESASVRQRVRVARGWVDKVVVLNVCRFQEAERRYKGVDFFLEAATAAVKTRREDDPRLVFVQCGKATPADVEYVERFGVTVAANVTDDEMVDLYCAADVYANFSQWEGWNLGIAQALAYGLPVVASDIQAHRLNFQVPLVKTPEVASRIIMEEARKIVDASYAPERIPVIDKWEDRLMPLADDLLRFWRRS